MYSFSDFEYCASIFMQHWCVLNGEREEFDGQLAQNARDIRLLLTSNKDIMDELRQITTKNIQIILPNQSNNFGKIGPFTFGFLAALIPGSAVATESSAQPPTQSTSTEGNTGSNTPTVQTNFPSQFKQIVRTMAALGSGLLQPKEIRDLIVDIVEKIVEPCSNFGWRSAEVDCFFTAIGDAWGELTCLPAEQIKSLQTSWDRLVLGTKLVSLRLFNEVFAALSIQ